MATITKRKQGWQARIRVKGYDIECCTFELKRDAEDWARPIESAMKAGTHRQGDAAHAHTVSEMVDRYKRDVLPHKADSTIPGQRRQLDWWAGQLGTVALADIKPSHVIDALDHLTCGPSTKNRYLAVISHAFTFAVKVRGWMERNPVEKIDKRSIGIREGKGRTRFLSNGERTALLDACKESAAPYLYPAVVLALSTGMRQGEQFGLTWDRVDLAEGRITLDHTKNGERRVCHLGGLALEVMREYSKVRRIGTSAVFPIGPFQRVHDSIRGDWDRVLKAARIDGFVWHDLRHSFASELAMSGATLAEIAETMGHKTLSMVKRYAHLTEGHTSKVVERMTSRVFGEG